MSFAVRLLLCAGALLVATSMMGCSALADRYEPAPGLMLESAKPAGLRAQFFGVTTIVISDDDNSIMIDGFFSRPGLGAVLLPLRPNLKRIDEALEKVDRVDAVLVAHGHHDHAMDSPIVAMKTGALFVGSESTLNIARRHGLHKSRMCSVRDRDTFSIGRFRVTVLETPHSAGSPHIPGALEAPLPALATTWDYLPGPNYNFLLEHPLGNILIMTSAAALKPGALKGVRADVVFLAVGHLAHGDSPDVTAAWYWREAVENTGATLVIPVHWDDFVTGRREWPLSLPPKLLDDAERGINEVRELASKSERKVDFKFMPLAKTVALPVGDRVAAFGDRRTVPDACAVRR